MIQVSIEEAKEIASAVRSIRYLKKPEFDTGTPNNSKF